MNNQIVSNFWTAVIASIILTASAILLKDNDLGAYVLIGELSGFGIRLGDEVLKTFNQGKAERLEAEIDLAEREIEILEKQLEITQK
tara:strand:- start:25306 stop:25566 length:261 start_codon:yes stop_codon:yes gene_type:complete